MEEEFKIDIQRDYRNRHKDKMAFLLGTGVSLDAVDANLLKPYVTLAINEALFKMSDPDYFFTCDGLIFNNGLLNVVSKEHTEVILIEELCLPESYKTFPEGRGLKKFNLVKRKVNVPEPESSIARQTDDMLVFGLSSAHPAAHLLHIMGCNPIVLLGCECRFTGSTYGFWMLDKYRDKIIPFYKDENGNPKHPAVYPKNLQGYLTEHKQYWERMKRLEHSLPLINACNGVMENLPRMSLTDVLTTYGDRTK